MVRKRKYQQQQESRIYSCGVFFEGFLHGKAAPFFVTVSTLTTHVSVVLCVSMPHQEKVTLTEEHLPLWDKAQERFRRIISLWTTWLASYLEAHSLFYRGWPRHRVTQTSVLGRDGVKSPSTRDMNPKNSRRRDIERKPRTTFHLEFLQCWAQSVCKYKSYMH